MISKSVTLVFAMLFAIQLASAQVIEPGYESPLDGVYSKSIDTPHKKPTPYVKLREADIMWSQRVWRVVDMREKMNHVFYYPLKPSQGRKNMMYLIMEAIELERITAYSPLKADSVSPSDMFDIPLTAFEAKSQLTRKETVTKYDQYGDPYDTVIVEDIPLEDIKRFKIKEEVFFDKQRSTMETRILGIAPQYEFYREGEFLGYRDAFWIYFPEARTVFAEAEVYNRQNDAHRLSYDDIFWKRMFSSYIVKVSNVYDRSIDRYKTPMDALYEAREMEENIRNREHDLWSF